MEPMNVEEPEDNFLQKVKNLTHQHQALLIFDEVITGFRYHLGGAQKLFGVTPDLAAFGKAMANGMSISALVGKRKYMKKVEDIFYSFTFGGETLSLAAAMATIKEMEKKKVIDYLWRVGSYLQKETRKIIKANGLDDLVKLSGKPCWQLFQVSPTKKYSHLEIESFIQQELISCGILWEGSHNLSFSHSQKDIDKLLASYRKIMPRLKLLLDQGKLKQNLRGEPIKNIFKVR